VRQQWVQSVAPILAWVLAVGPGVAASPVIGIVMSKGTFRVDNATVVGNATLFDGATIETHGTGSSMDLSTGAKVSLASESKGRFFGDRMILERGEGQLDQALGRAVGFRLEARGLTIRPQSGGASARVALGGGAQVQIEAATGSLRVLNSRGLPVANLVAGMTLAFDPQAPGTPSKLSGCLEKKAGHFLLTDETTKVTVELAGPGLDPETGNRVEVSGAMDPAATPVPVASQFIRVSTVKRTGKGCAANKSSAGISTTTIAIVGGVAVAATVGGVAAARRRSRKDDGSGRTISR
jgi:hypothetical protein